MTIAEKIRCTALALPGLQLVETRRHEDRRGHFSETYNRTDFHAAGIETDFVQDNVTVSVARGTIRGMHFQTSPQAQDKLIRVSQGAIFDVALDLRRGSPSYGKWLSTVLSRDDGRQLFIPRGFAHGYCTLTAEVEICYKVSAAYSPRHERGIRWDSPALSIDWPVDAGAAIIGDRDRILPLFTPSDDHFT